MRLDEQVIHAISEMMGSIANKCVCPEQRQWSCGSSQCEHYKRGCRFWRLNDEGN